MTSRAWNAPDAKPPKPDVYERDYTWDGRPATMLCMWDGREWMCGADSVEYAKAVCKPSAEQKLPWRERQPETTGLEAA